MFNQSINLTLTSMTAILYNNNKIYSLNDINLFSILFFYTDFNQLSIYTD